MHTVTLCVLSIVSADLTLLRIHAQVKNRYQLVTFSNVEIRNNTHLCTFHEHATYRVQHSVVAVSGVLHCMCSLTCVVSQRLSLTFCCIHENIDSIAVVAHKI